MTRISVVMPVRNGARYLAAALDSILAQSRPVDEAIVVDDGSTDDSAAIAAGHALRPRVMRQDGAGAAVARNHGLAAATGDRIAFLDADDLWEPHHLAVLGAVLDADPEAAIAFGHIQQFASPDLSPEERRRLHVPDGPEPGFVIGAMLARRTAFDRAGRFDGSLQSGDFIAWFMAARDAGLGHVLVEPIVMRRRLHASNLGRARPDLRLHYVRAIRAALHRRRGAAPTL